MRISAKTWAAYVDKLSRINTTAANMMQAYIDANGMEDAEALIDYAHALVTKYGEASGALACEMYDAIAVASGKALPAAEMAALPERWETAKAVQGTIKNKDNTVPATVGRMVKQEAADTTLQNAERDKAYFAWIPSGDTCAFCITLASRGWQRMSKRALKNGHAEHIHANCNCEYAISFDKNSQVEGYDPGGYKRIYDEAEGATPEEKINAIRRAQYAVETGKDNTITQALAKEPTKAREQMRTIAKQIKEDEPMNEYEYFSAEQEAYRLEEIQKQTGFSEEKAREVLDAMSGTRDKYIQNANAGNYDYKSGWFYGQDTAIRTATGGEAYEKAKLIDEYIQAAPKYDGTIYRGMTLPEDVVAQFQQGAVFTENGNISSWSSTADVATMFAEGRTEELGGVPVVLETVNAKYSTPAAHLSIFGKEENEVLVSNMHENKYIIEEVTKENGVVHVKMRLA